MLTRSRQLGKPWPPGRASDLTVPPGRCLRPVSAGLPPIRPGGCCRSAFAGLPPILLGSRFLTASHARLPSWSTIPSNRTQDPPKNVEYDREVLAAITAEDPAGIAMMYDKYAADLYDYCHWMLHDSADAARALKNTFVIAAATLSKLSEPSKLRPWLFALARDEGRRRIRPKSAARDDETDAMVQPPTRSSRPTRSAKRPT